MLIETILFIIGLSCLILIITRWVVLAVLNHLWKDQKPDPLGEINDSYIKVSKIISSCKTEEQFQVAKEIVKNFGELYGKDNPYFASLLKKL